jgi:predicted glycoside hydrolase/deacetylase ChbG (UPF0249 family)
MLIINADDWGRSRAETDAALNCYSKGLISSATAMVFMEDSERAAVLARSSGIPLGLHLNLVQQFTGVAVPVSVRTDHGRICRFLKNGKFTFLMYNPFLRNQFRRVYQAQVEEFERLYGKAPTHVDGHQHMHLCTNMLVDCVIPKGQKVRRSFSFARGEKGAVNRAYRDLVDRRLAGRYRLTDFFFSLGQCSRPDRLDRVAEASGRANVEVMTHPVVVDDFSYLHSGPFSQLLTKIQLGTFAMVP